jgi:ribosomal protein L12E/L44/L45/RPP1/RPP2
MRVWRRRREAASARLSAAPHSAHHKLYSEAAVSSAVALAEVGRFREAVDYVQRAAKALYEAAKEVFEHVKITVQRLIELFVETVTRVLAWVDEHKAYLFLMTAVAAGVIALSVALNLWGLVELERLAYAASAAPFVAGLADARGRAAERFGAVADRWKVDENEKQKIEEVINEVVNAPLKREGPFSKLISLENLPKPLVELRKALARVEDEAEKDAAVVAALVLYKTLMKNAGAYREWAAWYEWARGLVEEREFAVKVEEVKRLREAHKGLEEVAEQVRRELNGVLVLYSQSDFYKERPDLLNKLKQHLEVDLGEAEELAEARRIELSKYSDVNMGTKAYAALLSITRGGIYGHVAMLLAGEGALADIVMSAPEGSYKKARNIVKGRGESVDPSRSPRGVANWEDRAASALLRYLLGRAVSEDIVFRRVKGGFEVFRAYGGVETRVDVLKIEETVARSKAGEEVLGRFVEEAKKMVPDLSGIKKIWHALPWFATDVSFDKGWIVAGTAHTWQAAWYIALFGEPESSRGRTNVTEEGVKPYVQMRWPREVLERIIAEEGSELEPLLGRAVKSWRELVDAIDWSWVVERVEELVNKLKPWIGPEGASDAEREGLVRGMLGELALLAHFAEARRGMNDGRWREERAKRLSRAVEALSNGRIGGEYAERLARAIILYAEGNKKKAERRIKSLAEEVGISREELWSIVEFVLSNMYCLARDCARDEVVRKFVEPALELIMLDKALRGEFDKEKALLIFGEMYATAVAGDGTVGPREVELAVGGELGGGATLLRLAALLLLNQLLPDELKFGVRVYVRNGNLYNIAAYGENAARLKRLLAISAPSAGGEYLSPKFDQFVEAAKVEVRLDKDSIRLTESGYVAADLIISVGGAAVKYNVYLRNKAIELEFQSTDRSRVELAALLLRLAGVNVEVKRVKDEDKWYVRAYTDMLAAGREELRKALAEIVETARKSVGEEKAKRWLEKLEKGRVLMEGWPKYYVRLSSSGALEVRFASTDRNSIEQEAQRFREMGLVEGVHFTVKMPEEGRHGYVYIRREGLAHAAWLSVHGEGEQQRLAAAFVEYILQRAREAGDDVRKKAEEVVKKGKERDSLTLKGFEKEFEVNGRTYVVKVIGGEAVEEGRGGRKLLRIKITAEVDGVRSEYTITYGRYGAGNAVRGFAVAKAEADAERLAAVVEALTGVKPRIYRMKNGAIIIVCSREHLEGFARYAELANAIKKWLLNI